MTKRGKRWSRWTTLVAVALPLGAGCTAEPAPEGSTETMTQAVRNGALTFERLGSTPQMAPFDNGGAEIAAYDAGTKRLFSVNLGASRIDAFDIRDPASPVFVGAIAAEGRPNSVAVRDGVLAVAVAADPETDPGFVRFFDTATLTKITSVEVGHGPDAVVFTPDKRHLLVADEGQPSDDYAIDPPGSVSIIDMHAPTLAAVRVPFPATIADPMFRNRESVRVLARATSFAADAEPEYIAVSPDSSTAWVTLQENNAIAVLDIVAQKFTSIVGLGKKNHLLPGNGFDASDRDGPTVNGAPTGRIAIRNWPVLGWYMPDAVSTFAIGGRTYLVTANEGDYREYGAHTDVARFRALVQSGRVAPSSPAFPSSDNAALGRLNVSTVDGLDANGLIQDLHVFGARSLSVWTADVAQVHDTGDLFEQSTALAHPGHFNASNKDNTFDGRSDDKGPEPEGVTTAKLFGQPYAFVGLERIGGVMVFDLSDPAQPRKIAYLNQRDFTVAPPVGDIGPEGLLVIAAEQSPTGKPLLVLSNEVSGTTSFYEIGKAK